MELEHIADFLDSFKNLGKIGCMAIQRKGLNLSNLCVGNIILLGIFK
jgi:hypothetical protein